MWQSYFMALYQQGVVGVITRTMSLELWPALTIVALHQVWSGPGIILTVSMIMSLNRPEPPSIGMVAAVLCMDRKTLTAALKPLQRRGLVTVTVDANDGRSRRLKLTRAGRALLARAVPVWRRTHAEIDRLLPGADADRLRRDLRALT